MSAPETYTAKIEAALGIAVEGKTAVNYALLDHGNALGVAVRWPDGLRHAVRVIFAPGWDDETIAKIMEWKAARD